MELDSQFRNKDFQQLVTTELYEEGTDSQHVQSVIRLGCV